jgi:type III secretion system chaperone SycN
MSWIESTLKEFGNDININNLEFNQDGVICLEFGDETSFYIEKGDDFFILYLAVKIPINKSISLSKALSMTHYKYNRKWQINAGLRDDDTIVFIVRIAPDEFTLPNIESILEMLNNINDEMYG